MRLVDLLQRAHRILRHPGNRWHWLRAARRAQAFRAAVRRGTFVDLDFVFGTRIRCWADSDTARSVAYYCGLYDFDQMSFLASYLRPGDHVLDVGANIGTYAVLMAALVGPGGRVDAFEPVAKTFSRLNENLALNALAARVHAHPCAIGDTSGWLEMTQGLDAVNRVALHASDGTARVPVQRLDDVVGEASPVFGKMDIEGMEWPALKGAHTLLNRHRPPVWMVEINGALGGYGLEAPAFVDWMRSRGYASAKFDARNRTMDFSAQAWDDVFFVAVDSLHFVASRLPGVRFAGAPSPA